MSIEWICITCYTCVTCFLAGAWMYIVIINWRINK